MLYKQILEREKQIRQLQKESKINFLIVTFTTSLLTILGVFMSHSNSEMFIGGIKKSYISVISTDPVNKAVNEVYKKVITVKFNEEIDPATINSKTFILMQGLNPIAGEVTPTSSQTDAFSFTPEGSLLPSAVYTVAIKKGVKSLSRNILREDYSWSFTTQPQVTLTSNPMKGGATTGGGAFNSDVTVTVEAISAEGYTFKNWTENSQVISSSVDYVFTLVRNKILVANFEPITEQKIESLASNSQTDSIKTKKYKLESSRLTMND